MQISSTSRIEKSVALVVLIRDEKLDFGRHPFASSFAKEDKAYVEKFKTAVTYLERLTRANDKDPNVWDALATAYGNAGMFKEAKKAIEKADELRK